MSFMMTCEKHGDALVVYLPTTGRCPVCREVSGLSEAMSHARYDLDEARETASQYEARADEADEKVDRLLGLRAKADELAAAVKDVIDADTDAARQRMTLALEAYRIARGGAR